MKLSKADIHIHSNYSDAVSSVEDIIDYVSKKTDLKVIAITDHDTIKGAQKAQQVVLERKIDLQVIVGEEISSKEGHILGLFLTKRIRPGLTAEKTIKKIKKQGGLAIASHPFYQTGYKKNGLELGGIGIERVSQNQNKLDGLETINGNILLYFGENNKAIKLNQERFKLAETGGSDAHFLRAIGKSYTLFPGTTANDLKNSILDRQTKAVQDSWDIEGILEYTIRIAIQGFLFVLFIIRTSINGLIKKIRNNIFSSSDINSLDLVSIEDKSRKNHKKNR